jgi:multidrug efflux pump subunit AcrA (membrane-fusion protein)
LNITDRPPHTLNTTPGRPLIVTLLFLAVLLAACSTSADGRDRRGTGTEPTPIPTAAAALRPTYTVARGAVATDLTFNGRVAPSLEQPLSFAANGVVGQVYAQRGDTVAAGDLIAELDTADLEAQLVLAQSALAIVEERLAAVQRENELTRVRAETRRDLAQLDLDFALAQGGAAPTAAQQYEIDRLTLLLRLAQLDVDELSNTVDPQLAADVDAAALRVAELERALGETTLTAPFDGVLTALNLPQGRAVGAGEPVGAVADATEIEVTATLRETDLQQLAEGMAALITPASGPGDVLPGRILSLPYPYGSGGETAAADGDLTTRIGFDDMAAAHAAYEPGDRVDVIVRIAERDTVLWLPPAAIRDFNGRKFVVIDDGGVQQRSDVTLGLAGRDRIEILSGVQEGQIIVGQ